ncbi:MAG: flagellar protein FlaG [Marinobacter sp.]|nr:flagellar protein FlaG [Marinobacter sp.]
MNDVNLNSPDLKLVRSGAQAPAKAMSSSQAEGRNAPDRTATPAATPAAPAAQSTRVSDAEALQARAEQQRKELTEAVSQLNDFVQNVQRDLQFEVDNDMGRTIVKVVDQQTQEVIRQIPDEVAVRLAEKLQQNEPLTLFNITV